jgi:hypothetical protein
MLPQLAFSAPEKFLAFLERNGSTFLEYFWNECGKHIAEEQRLDPEGLGCNIYPLDDDIVAACITLPQPTEMPEAYYIAFVHRPASEDPLDSKRVFTRYFTLEYGQRIDGSPRTVLCEWTADGSHLNYGDGPPPQMDLFINSIESLLSD